MTIRQMDNVLIVVEDLETVIGFCTELGLELASNQPLNGRWVEQVIGLDNVRQEAAVLRTPDGRSGIELAEFHTPPAIRPEPASPPANTLGLRRVMFAVDDVDDTVARLRATGGELVGDIVQFEDSYRLCYVRGPENIVVGPAQPLS